MAWTERLNRWVGRVPLGKGHVELIHWAQVNGLPTNRPHRHTYFEVCQVGENGEGHFNVEGVPHPIRPGDIFFARPGVEHQIVNTGKDLIPLTWVAFQFSNLSQWDSPDLRALVQSFAASRCLVVPDQDGRVKALWKALQSVAEQEPFPGQIIQLEHLTAALIMGIARVGCSDAQPTVYSLTKDAHREARLAIQYIHDNLDKPLGLDDIARQIHLSRRQFCRVFQAFAGTSPSKYILQARLDRANIMLQRTDMPIKQIALELGFSQVPHFNRCFVKRFGVTPGSLRKKSA